MNILTKSIVRVKMKFKKLQRNLYEKLSSAFPYISKTKLKRDREKVPMTKLSVLSALKDEKISSFLSLHFALNINNHSF
jgi:hypothetical protein